MDSNLKDKVVFITGATGGIGKELARAFANEGAKIAAKWGASYNQFAMQFALPVEGSHMARFIPLEGTTALYTEFYKEHAYKDLYMAGLGTEVAGYGANSKVKVPESSAYPTDYLAANHNSAGRVTALMLPAATE